MNYEEIKSCNKKSYLFDLIKIIITIFIANYSKVFKKEVLLVIIELRVYFGPLNIIIYNSFK